jgi:hypothetical protein
MQHRRFSSIEDFRKAIEAQYHAAVGRQACAWAVLERRRREAEQPSPAEIHAYEKAALILQEARCAYVDSATLCALEPEQLERSPNGDRKVD